MKPIRILVDSFADQEFTNAQMRNAREIVRRLDPAQFDIRIFRLNQPDPLVAQRPNTRLIALPQHLQTVRILREFFLGNHDILFYVKPSPASKWYLRARLIWKDHRITIGTIESRSDLRSQPTIASEAAQLWEQTVLRCDYLFSNSQAVKLSLEQEYGLHSGIVPTGVDTKFFMPADRPPNARPRVLFVGSLRPFKQPHLIVVVAARFAGADFVIVGEGPMAAELKQQVRQENLANVAFIGPLGAEDLKKQYQQADLLLHPSTWEGSPKVILEAAACGLPVIARKDYAPETIVDRETGYLVTSDQELFMRLDELLSHREVCQTLGRAGRKHVGTFDWDSITRQWGEIFQRLMAQRAIGLK